MVDPCQYIFLNEGLGMSAGKAAAQAAHAAVEGYRATPQDSNILRLWYRSGHYKKIVLGVRDNEHLWAVREYLRERAIASRVIIDEGRTELQPMVPTAIGVEVLDKNHPHNAGIFSAFQLYKDPRETAALREKLMSEFQLPQKQLGRFTSWLPTKRENNC